MSIDDFFLSYTGTIIFMSGIALFWLLFYVRVWYIERGKPWWDKLLTYTLTTVVFSVFCGFGLLTGYNNLYEQEHQVPKVTTPSVPTHWWRCN